MPKIPTFTARVRPTTEAPSVKTGIQISPTATVASALLPAANQITNFHIKKRDLAEKLEANKVIQSIKGEMDIVINKQKDNANEENVLNVIQENFNNFKNNSLSNIKNKRVKSRIENGLAIEYPEFINTAKINSYNALETQTTKVLNDKLNNLISKYSTTTNFILKSKYKSQGLEDIKNFAKDFELSDFSLNEKLKTFNKNLLSGDFVSFVGKEKAIENIFELDKSYGVEKTLSNEEFSASVLNAYESKVSEITIIGDENADFDKALDLINEARKVKRSNGFNLNFGETKKKLDTLEQSILNEKITHENRIDYINQGKELNEYIKDQKSILSSSFFNQFSVDLSGTLNKEKSLESQNEFDKRFSNYESINPDATLDEKKEYAVELRLAIQDRYKEKDIRDLTNFNLDKNKFELITEEKGIKAAMSSYQRYLKNPKLIDVNNDFYDKQVDDDVRLINRKTVLNGFVDEKGNPDVNLFYNTFIEILNNQKKD